MGGGQGSGPSHPDGVGPLGVRTNCIHSRRSGPRYSIRSLPNIIFFPALMINLFGLAISTTVFVIEIMFYKTNKT